MKKSVLMFAMLLFGSLLHAQSVLLLPSDAASLGYANTSLTAEVTASAAEYNPSALVFSPSKMAVGAGYGLWLPAVSSASLLSAGGWYHGRTWGGGLQVKRLGMEAYVPTNENGVASQIEDPFKPSELTVSLGAGFALGHNFSVGATLRLISSSLGNNAKAISFNADISACYDNGPLRAAVKMGNLGPKLKFNEEDSSAQPTLFSAGVSYGIVAGLRAQVQADYLFDGSFMAGLGAAYCWRNMLSARAGYHLGTGTYGTQSYASAGLGVRFVGVSLDAAYVFLGENLRNTFLITLSYTLPSRSATTGN